MNLPARKIKVRAGSRFPPMAFRVEAVPAALSRPLEDQSTETGRVVRRLESIVATHLESGHRMATVDNRAGHRRARRFACGGQWHQTIGGFRG